ncbi:uncharacterized protein LOC118203460 [Stegodyphus dumicola]|uniref:uncharacterized protein LOC118203460 n=1 Tax=Stegodyphus dumicola TaxID=202533 RepID=UPI0015A88296|nr:uncharacterized protein LOC118203460 [Stegodyphus dumicola]
MSSNNHAHVTNLIDATHSYLRISLFNANGVYYKKLELMDFLSAHDIDIMLISETHLKPCDKFKIPGYSVIRSDRLRTTRGGTAVVIKNHIKFNTIKLPTTTRLEYTAILASSTTNENYLIVAAYNPPQDINLQDLDIIMSTNFPTILAGDLNAKDRSWGARMEVKKELSSDHYPVVFDFHGFYPDPPRKRTKVNWTSFTDKLRNMPCNPHLRDSGEIESEIYSLTSKIQNAIKSSSYACRDTLRNKLPEDISRDIKERNRIRKRFNVTQDPSLKRTINYLNRKIQAGIMEFRSSNWDNLLEHFSTDTSSMWKIVNAMKKDRTYHIAPISHMGSTHYSEEDIANVLLPAIGKIFEKALNNRITDHLERLDLIDPAQFGFRKHHSTTHQVLNIVEIITRAFFHKTGVAACFIDLEKAFDKVWHEGLIYKLNNFLFPVSLVKLIISYLKRRTFQVRVGDSLSGRKIIASGVPQGSVIGPKLFNIFVNDLPNPLNAKTLKYADDTVILSESKSPQLALTNLQFHINIVAAWCQLWRIKINTAKCKIVQFRRYRRNVTTNTDIKIENDVIPVCSSAKYLGVTLDDRLTFKEHVTNQVNKANGVFMSLYTVIGRKSKLSLKAKRMIYLTMIRPVMLYAAPAWAIANKTDRRKLEVLQNKILRAITNAPWFVRNSIIHADLKIKPIPEQILMEAHNFFEKMDNSPVHTLRELGNYDPTVDSVVKRPRSIHHNARW